MNLKNNTSFIDIGIMNFQNDRLTYILNHEINMKFMRMRKVKEEIPIPPIMKTEKSNYISIYKK